MSTAGHTPAKKPGAIALTRTPAQKAAETRAAKKAQADALEKANAQRLAQIVNLHIAGLSLAEIGVQIGMTGEEVDRMLSADTQRYVRNQPALRTYVRNYVSQKYNKMLDSVWDKAIDQNDHQRQMESQDRALRILDRMARLHGAEAPVQKEVHVEAAPEAVERLVNALASAGGHGYDDSIFDVVDAEVIHDAADAEFPETDMGSDGDPDAAL